MKTPHLTSYLYCAWLISLVFFALEFPLEALAASADPFATSKDKAIDVFHKARDVILILGGIGILALAVMSFFGKFRWMWMLSLIAGLVMVLVAGSFIEYFSGQNVGLDHGALR